MNLHSVCLPTLHTYEQAKKYYDDVVPLRSGPTKGKRPLGLNRRYRYCQIAHYPETNAIALQLYGSDVVTLFPNGQTHVSLCKYDTVSTRQFIQATTGYGVRYERGTTYLGVDGGWYAFHNAESPLILFDGKVTNPIQEATYKLNRAAMREIQNRYGGFREYVKSMGLMLTGIKDTEVHEVAGFLPNDDRMPLHHSSSTQRRLRKLVTPLATHRYFHGIVKPLEGLKEFLASAEKAQAEGDLRMMYGLFVQLGVSSLYYHVNLNSYTRSWHEPEVEIATPMLKYFDEILKHYYKEKIFYTIDLPIGTKSTNTNRKYFK